MIDWRIFYVGCIVGVVSFVVSLLYARAAPSTWLAFAVVMARMIVAFASAVFLVFFRDALEKANMVTTCVWCAILVALVVVTMHDLILLCFLCFFVSMPRRKHWPTWSRTLVVASSALCSVTLVAVCAFLSRTNAAKLQATTMTEGAAIELFKKLLDDMVSTETEELSANDKAVLEETLQRNIVTSPGHARLLCCACLCLLYEKVPKEQRPTPLSICVTDAFHAARQAQLDYFVRYAAALVIEAYVDDNSQIDAVKYKNVNDLLEHGDKNFLSIFNVWIGRPLILLALRTEDDELAKRVILKLNFVPDEVVLGSDDQQALKALLERIAPNVVPSLLGAKKSTDRDWDKWVERVRSTFGWIPAEVQNT